MTCMLYAVILDITAWEAWCLKCEQTYTVKKSGENWNVIEYVDGVEWKSCIVDTSMIWNFHSTLSANTHWKFNFRRFFLQCQFTLFLSVPALANMHQKTASLTLLIILQELDNYIHTYMDMVAIRQYVETFLFQELIYEFSIIFNSGKSTQQQALR